MNKRNFLIAIAIIVLCAASRLVKHPFNFTPLIAMVVFSGAYLKNRMGIVITLAALLLSDYFLGFYDVRLMSAVYLSVILIFYISISINKHPNIKSLLLTSVVSSILFFIITNLSVWLFTDWYPKTWSGLLNCFILALPFFRNSFLGDMFYSAAFFFGYRVIVNYSENKIFSLLPNDSSRFKI